MNKLIVEKPWGKFEQFTHNQASTVKVLTILPNNELSLQYHNNRIEFIVVIVGHPKIIIGEKEILAKPNDEYIIGKGVKHKISAIDDEVKILEISFGDFDEDDIVRLEDKYGRVK